jgi:cation diffusion facilitator CzcD-associated flavoprotein CzcO
LIACARLRRQVPDLALRARLTPRYTIGCKRILVCNDYLPALTKPTVDLVTSGLAQAGADWVQAADGTRREVDTVIFGTGFHVTGMPMALRIHGRDGRTLADVWSDGAQAHRGTMVAGFPNLFMLVGPNTGLGHSSLIYMIECQVAYIIDALRHLRRSGAAAVEVRAQAQVAYNESSSVGWGPRCGRWAAARAGTSTRRAATRRCGRRSPGDSAGPPAGSSLPNTWPTSRSPGGWRPDAGFPR